MLDSVGVVGGFLGCGGLLSLISSEVVEVGLGCGTVLCTGGRERSTFQVSDSRAVVGIGVDTLELFCEVSETGLELRGLVLGSLLWGTNVIIFMPREPTCCLYFG